jgi:hypothetical protein
MSALDAPERFSAFELVLGHLQIPVDEKVVGGTSLRFRCRRRMRSERQEMITGVFLGPLHECIIEPALTALAEALPSDPDDEIYLAAVVRQIGVVSAPLWNFFNMLPAIDFRWSTLFA